MSNYSSSRYVRKDEPPKETPTPPRRRQKKKRKPRLLLAIVVLVLIAVCGRCVAFGVQMLAPSESQDQAVVQVEIPMGSTPKDIARILAKENIIKNKRSFSWYCTLHREGANFKAGYYELSPGMDMEEIVATLNKGGSDAPGDRFVVREGETVDTIAENLAKTTDIKEEDFLKAVNDASVLEKLEKDFPETMKGVASAKDVRYALEGYLFPATYNVPKDASAEDVIYQMVKKTDEVLAKEKDAIKASPYTLHEVLTMASLIEKEGNTEADRAKIAAVFYNRMKIDMPIQSDISVLYALRTHKELVTYKDLEVDSPYNLYKHTGLGPGPFNNPGEDAIHAALNPEKIDALYFIADMQTGKVFFTKDYEQHLAWQKELNDTGHIKG